MRFQKIGMRLKNVRSKKRACGCEQGLWFDKGEWDNKKAMPSGYRRKNFMQTLE